MNAIEIPVVLAPAVIVVDAILIPGIDEIGSEAIGERARQHEVDPVVAAFAIVGDPAGRLASLYQALVETLGVSVHQQVQILADSKIQSRTDVSQLFAFQTEVGWIEGAREGSRRLVEHAGRRGKAQRRRKLIVESDAWRKEALLTEPIVVVTQAGSKTGSSPVEHLLSV